MKIIVTAGILVCCSFSVMAEVVGEAVEYTQGELTFKGYLAYDDAVEGPQPGILVVHEWWGHNEYARKRARMLAEAGYTALAVDMYGDGKRADHPKDAGRFAGEVRQNMSEATARFVAAKRLLQSHRTVSPDEISAIGYCFGGGVVLEMARRGVDLDLVGSFHGSLGTDSPAEAGSIKARVMVYNGADDPFVKPEQIEAFKTEMTAAEVNFQFTNYPGAKHSFTNSDADTFGEKFKLPLAYNRDADQSSWDSLMKELAALYPR
ncbi:MAG: dienelactone hydrolase family protein [Gammaproteobacteria bacterium]|nr:dienelactone hydrolase family protein [Gammaproteobacteria bacterium]